MTRRERTVHPVAVARRATRRRLHALRDQRTDDSGFTLIELVVVVAILPIIVGAMTAALMTVISFQPKISDTLSDSGDAQVLSTNFDKDVTGATMITGNASSTSPPQCGPGTQILGLQFGSNTEVSYSLVTNGSGPSAVNNLYRSVCQLSGTSPNVTNTLTSSLIAAHNVVGPSGNGVPAAVVTCSTPTAAACLGTPEAWQAGWVAVAQIASVSMPLTYASSNYTQTPTAAPTSGINSGSGGSLNTPTYTCGFATQDTGTYASTLCFFDFTGWNTHTGTTPCGNGGQQLTDGIANTPFTMSFCLTVTGGPVAGASIPTYTNPPTSEAFLGNNGFYTGIPGNPALYQSTEGTTSTISITNIQVLGTNNTPATNWNLVTGDAESTDAGESQVWTAGWSAGSSVPANQQVFTLIDNSTTSAIGNACANPTPGNGLSPGNGLTGVGTASVTCAASVSSDKTGTAMISAPAPTSLTDTMVGTGLEAMFIGILLPS
jgi:prepilin-type N-terminal cleavage/methylation domain-containing protein